MKYIAGLLLTGILGFAAEIPQDGLKAEMAGKWDEAATIYKNILAKEPERTDLYIRLSDIYIKEKQFDKAAEVLKQAIAAAPKNAKLYERLAILYAVLNKPEDALSARDKTLELDPKNVSYLVAHARIANWLKKSDIAARDLKQALALDPANGDLLFLLSQSSEWAQKNTDAIQEYQKYLERNPDNLQIWLTLANLQLLQGNIKGSNETLKKAYARFIGTGVSKTTNTANAIADISVPVLEYHCVDDKAANMYWVSTDEFEAQMSELSKNGYHSVTMDDIGNAIVHGASLPEKPVAVTFDDGCQNLYAKAFPILNKYGMKAQVYVVTNSIGIDERDRRNSATAKLGENGESALTYYLTWPEIRELSKAGWGIGSHTRAHTDMRELDEDNRLHELLFSKLAILENAKLNTTAFSYPYGYGSGETAIHQELASYGYLTAVASSGGIAELKNTDVFNIPRIMVYGPKPSIDPQSNGVSVTANLSRPNDKFMYKIEPDNAEKAYEKARLLLTNGQNAKALASINKAVELSPNTIRYLRTQMHIAGMANDSAVTAAAAEKLYALESTDDNLLELARAYSWNNRLNEADDCYSLYRERHPQSKEAWIEHSHILLWLGRYEDTLETLEGYKDKFGADDTYLEVKAEALSWGNRPRSAFTILDTKLKNDPKNYIANYTNTVALDKNFQPVEAVQSLEKVEAIRPEAVKDNAFLRKYITTKFRPSITGGIEYYTDSYHVDDLTLSLEGEYHLSPISALSISLKSDYLNANKFSGYEKDDGSEKADYRSSTIGYTTRISPDLSIRGAIGAASAEEKNDAVYSVGALWSPLNTFSLDAGFSHDYYVISPRTVGRGIKDDRAHMNFHWEPSMKVLIDATGQYDWLSDDNRRWEINLAPKFLMARTQYWNLDVGPSVRLYGFDKQYDDHGYYSPELVQGYYATGYFYWKKSEDDGVGVVLSAGTVHDSYADSFKPGGGIAAEGTFGFYQDWMLKTNIAFDYNTRFTDHSYIGRNFSIYLTRRF